VEDRSRAYRELFTRNKIREALDSFDNIYDRSEFIYDCVELALESNDQPHNLNVGNILHKVLENKGN
tara:strand:+ start:205 stop:405 length:201 start_codon:yes stop_codon:yes gene_type:complete